VALALEIRIPDPCLGNADDTSHRNDRRSQRSTPWERRLQLHPHRRLRPQRGRQVARRARSEEASSDSPLSRARPRPRGSSRVYCWMRRSPLVSERDG
jgi:hypothetical protein